METLQKVLHPVSLLQSERLVVVTGADKGIGFAVVKGILRAEPNWTVYLTSPDNNLGEEAVRRCYDEIKLRPKFHQLDIDDIDSIRRFRDHIRDNHKHGIHVLVNNAGIYPDVRAQGTARTGFEGSMQETTGGTTTTTGTEGLAGGHVEQEVREAGTEVGGGEQKTEEQKQQEEGKKEEHVQFKFDREAFRNVIKNNYFSTLQVCQELFPLLGDNSSVIFVGSRLGNLAFMHTKEDKQWKLRGCTRVEDCSAIMEQLMNTDPDKLFSDDPDSWLTKSPDTEVIPHYKLGAIYPWAMSKLGLAVICRIYQLQFDGEKQDQNVHVVTCCPGLVKTDLNPLGVKTPEQGADTIVWTALLPKDSNIRGVVCADRKMLDPFVLPEGSTIF